MTTSAEINLANFAAQLASGGIINTPATGKYFSPLANIQKVNDRLFIGGATQNDGAFPPVALDWLSTYEDSLGFTNFTMYGKLAVLTDTSANDVVGITVGAQSLTSTNSSASCIAIEAFGLHNNATHSNSAWAFYGEAHKRVNSGNVFGMELDVHTGFTGQTPSPYGGADSICLQLSDGAGVGGAQFTGSVSGTTLTVANSPYPLIPQLGFLIGATNNLYGALIPLGTTILSQLSGTPGGLGTYQISANLGTIPAAFMSASNDFVASSALQIRNNIIPFLGGITFGQNSLAGTDGISGGIGAAIQLATFHAIEWFNSSGALSSFIINTIATPSNGTKITFADAGFTISNVTGGALFQAPAVPSVVNYIQVLGAATGGSPLISAVGTDANPNLRFSAQGTGTINCLSPLKTANGLERLFTTTITAATYSVLATDNHLLFNAAGTCTVTLPSAASFSGREITMRTIAAQTVVSASSNVVPLAGGAAGTAILAGTAGKWAYLVSDGTNWEIHMSN